MWRRKSCYGGKELTYMWIQGTAGCANGSGSSFNTPKNGSPGRKHGKHSFGLNYKVRSSQLLSFLQLDTNAENLFGVLDRFSVSKSKKRYTSY